VERDIRNTPSWTHMEEHFRAALEPAFGRISGAADPVALPDGRTVVFTGTMLERLEGIPTGRVCAVDINSGRLDVLTGGPHSDRLPKPSPDGMTLAFLSDRKEQGRFGLYLLHRDRLGEAVAAPEVEGTVESLAWLPDGSAIMLLVAGPGTEKAAVQGSGSTKQREDAVPDWMPKVNQAPTQAEYRRLYLYDPGAHTVVPVMREGLNAWEAVPAGVEAFVAVVSAQPTEDAWYSATLVMIDRASSQERTVYESVWQLGHPVASPNGEYLAVVEATCSDRGAVAGDLLLIETASGEPRLIETGVDVTGLEWRNDTCLLYGGVRELESVVGEYDVRIGETREVWCVHGSSNGGPPEPSPAVGGGFLLVTDSFTQYPELTLVRDGQSQQLTSLAHPGAEYLQSLAGHLEEIVWPSTDGLEIQGLLLRPVGEGPYPLITHVHGGPVSSIRSRWIGPGEITWLVSKGYAFLFPNPRGSTGRGQDFVRMVVGDLGGLEVDDDLSGIEALVQRGIADADRLGVMGGSHGGYMTCRLLTLTDRFQAAVPMHPISDLFSQHNTSNIGSYDRIFLGEGWERPGNAYYDRSPIITAATVTTPTLLTAGEIDRCTPPTQAHEFHEALLKRGTETVLVTYPGEGHGVRKLPARIDLAARIVEWFERHMPV
jgi:dipeptidyl aminopeptidase/acylaminoacyl peptidase